MKNIYIKISFIASIVFCPLLSNSASFDCSKASTPFEKTICGNSSLSSLDEQLANVYGKARANSPNPDQLKAEQIAWIKNARTCGTDVSCIQQAYNSRIAALGPALPMPTSQAPKQALVEPTQQAQKKQDSEKRDPAVLAAGCGGHYGMIAMIQKNQGDFAKSNANFNKFAALDDKWQKNPNYLKAQKNFDKLLTDTLKADRNKGMEMIGQLGQFCADLGYSKAQL